MPIRRPARLALPGEVLGLAARAYLHIPHVLMNAAAPVHLARLAACDPVSDDFAAAHLYVPPDFHSPGIDRPVDNVAPTLAAHAGRPLSPEGEARGPPRSLVTCSGRSYACGQARPYSADSGSRLTVGSSSPHLTISPPNNSWN